MYDMTLTTTSTESVLDTLARSGGTLTVGQISSATSLRRPEVDSALKALSLDGKVQKVGGSVWRVTPGTAVVKPQVAVVPPKVNKPKARVASKGRPAYAAPRREALLKALRAAGGVADIQTLARIADVSPRAVGWTIHRLKKDGKVVSPKLGVYALKGIDTSTKFLSEPTPAPVQAGPIPVKAKRDYGRGPAVPGSKPKEGTQARRIYNYLAAAGGKARNANIAFDLTLKPKTVSDALFHLKARGWIENRSDGYVGIVRAKGLDKPAEIVDRIEARRAEQAPVQAPAPVAPQVDPVPVPPVTSGFIQVVERTTEEVISDLLALVSPSGIPATTKATKAALKFVTAAERLIEVTRN